jgi:hypothetical protein
MKTEVIGMRATLLALLTAAVLFTGTALAHHGWNGYDDSKPLTLTGVIRDANWANPHATLKLQVDEGKGKTWTATLAPLSRMESRGLNKGMLKAGSTVTVVGSPSKTDQAEVKAERITIAGKTTELRR